MAVLAWGLELKRDLKKLDALLQASVVSQVPLLSEMLEHIALSEGKRLRPTMVILMARMAGYVGSNHVRLAAVVELLHAATLLHDDVIDAAQWRRGRVTVGHRWSGTHSVLSGDYLYAIAFEMLCDMGHLEALRVVAAATRDVVEGEVWQLGIQGSHHVGLETYARVIEAKTARLFAASAQLGVLLADVPETVLTACRALGHHFGMLYQMMDDLLDYGMGQVALGKTLGEDVREHRPTLPWLLAYQAASPAHQVQLREGLIAGDVDTILAQVKGYLNAPEGQVHLQSVLRPHVTALHEHSSNMEAAGLHLASHGSDWRMLMQWLEGRLPVSMDGLESRV